MTWLIKERVTQNTWNTIWAGCFSQRPHLGTPRSLPLTGQNADSWDQLEASGAHFLKSRPGERKPPITVQPLSSANRQMEKLLVYNSASDLPVFRHGCFQATGYKYSLPRLWNFLSLNCLLPTAGTISNSALLDLISSVPRNHRVHR